MSFVVALHSTKQHTFDVSSKELKAQENGTAVGYRDTTSGQTQPHESAAEIGMHSMPRDEECDMETTSEMWQALEPVHCHGRL